MDLTTARAILRARDASPRMLSAAVAKLSQDGDAQDRWLAEHLAGPTEVEEHRATPCTDDPWPEMAMLSFAIIGGLATFAVVIWWIFPALIRATARLIQWGGSIVGGLL